MPIDEKDVSVSFYVQIDQAIYKEARKLLSSHVHFCDSEGKELRDIIKRVADILKMKIHK